MLAMFRALFLFSFICIGLTACTKPQAPVSVEQASEFASLPIPEPAADFLNRDVRDDVFYFVLPDRFYNGEPANDMGSSDIKISRGGLDVTSKWAFHGGDMQGLEQKLDYLQSLGVSAIWMTPILRNKAIQNDGFAHHGYWILDFTQIDPHFGSNEALHSLIAAAHERDIKVFFDIITNHTADVIKYRECHKPNGEHLDGLTQCEFKSLAQIEAGDQYTPFVPESEKEVKTPAWLNDPAYYHNQGDSFWRGESSVRGDFVGLDDLKTSHPQVVSGMIDIYKNIISTFKPDGFRVDTVKHVNIEFWQQFMPEIMAHAREQGIPRFHVFGEVYDGNPMVLSRYTSHGKMPSVLDFGFQGASNAVFFRDESSDAIRQLIENDDFYNDHDSRAEYLMNFLGNHDMGRAGFFIQQAQPDADDREHLARNKLAQTFMYLSRGIPVVYYGDEQGFTGDGGDVDSRENMFASQVASYNDNDLIGTDKTTADDNFDTRHPLYQWLGGLAGLRQQHKALRQGIQVNRYFSDEHNGFAFARVAPDEGIEYLAAFNPHHQPLSFSVQASSQSYTTVMGQTPELNQGMLTFNLPAFSATLVKADSPIVMPETVSVSFDTAKTEQDRVILDYAVSGLDKVPVSLLAVSTEFQDDAGEWHLLATDYTAPYRAVLKTGHAAVEAPLRVSIKNGNKLFDSQTFQLP